jgi:hypothetical protein
VAWTAGIVAGLASTGLGLVAAAVVGAAATPAAAHVPLAAPPSASPSATPVAATPHPSAPTGKPRPHRRVRRLVRTTSATARPVPVRAPVRVVTPATHRAATATHAPAPFVAGPTHWSALNAAIARIPSYRHGGARWIVSAAFPGWWGTADWYHDTLYIDPSVPVTMLYDVAVHEWSHELSVLDYGGDVDSAVKAMTAWFGGTSDLAGSERAADCMAILQGATHTHYTTCHDSHWRAGAARLLAGERL